MFRQGGSLRMTVPKHAVSKLQLVDGEDAAIFGMDDIAIVVPLKHLLDRDKITAKIEERLKK